MSKHCIKIKAMWFDKNVGLNGYYGAILHDGTPVAICSHEKWSLGKNDSLRSNWNGDIKIYNTIKKAYLDYDEDFLKIEGLLKGSKLEMKVPNSLLHLVKTEENDKNEIIDEILVIDSNSTYIDKIKYYPNKKLEVFWNTVGLVTYSEVPLKIVTLLKNTIKKNKQCSDFIINHISGQYTHIKG